MIHVNHYKSTPSPSPHKCLRGIEKHYFHTHDTAVRKIILLIHALRPDLFLSSFSSILSISTIIPDLSRGAPGGTSALVSSQKILRKKKQKNHQTSDHFSTCQNYFNYRSHEHHNTVEQINSLCYLMFSFSSLNNV